MKIPKREIYFDRKKESFTGIDEEAISYLKYLFPAINIPNELEKMKLWLLTNTRGKSYTGSLSFISNWLNRHPLAQVKTPEEGILGAETGSILDNLINEYLQELWKNPKSQKLFDFNQIKQLCKP